jgi:hypothetical protein
VFTVTEGFLLKDLFNFFPTAVDASIIVDVTVDFLGREGFE